jgi:general secretion pathway protein M
MKEWWDQLTARERQLVTVGGTVLGFLILWFVVLSPIYHGAQTARSEYQDNASLAQWMKIQVQAIKTLKQKGSVPKKAGNENILALVERLLKESPLGTIPHELAQKEKNTVTLNISEVGYAELMRWLSKAQQEHAIRVTDATLKRISKEAIVSANLVLTQ